MNIFQQIAPRLSRSNQAESASNGTATLDNSLKPLFEIKESPEAWTLTVQLPGVSKENLEVTAENDQITVIGRRSWQPPADWTALYRESVDAPYQLVLEHENNVDVAKIAAELKDGVLTVSLPKTEAVKPRKVTIS